MLDVLRIMYIALQFDADKYREYASDTGPLGHMMMGGHVALAAAAKDILRALAALGDKVALQLLDE